MDYQDDVKYQQTCKEAIEDGIVVNTIQCGSMAGTEPIWREMALLAEGEYFQVAQNGSAVRYTTPYDEEIAALSRELDDTRVYYGSREDLEHHRDRNDKAKEIYESADVSAVAQRAYFNNNAAGKANLP